VPQIDDGLADVHEAALAFCRLWGVRRCEGAEDVHAAIDTQAEKINGWRIEIVPAGDREGRRGETPGEYRLRANLPCRALTIR
jgi:hypothetical protein